MIIRFFEMNNVEQRLARLTRSTDLSVQQLHTFRLVFEQNGYAAAARASGLSVPTVWQQINSLEQLYGEKLFEKQGRRINPTPAANRLYQALVEILCGLESTFDIVKPAGESAGSITLVMGVRMLLEDLAKPLAKFQKQYGNTLAILHGNNRRAEQLIAADEADMALTLESGYRQETPHIHYEPAYLIDFLAVAPKSHPFSDVGKASLRELVKHDLVVTVRGTHGRDALEHALHRERLHANIKVETDNSGFTIACVQAGMGVGILAGRSEGQLCRRLAVHSFSRQLGRRQIMFMWKKGRILTQPMLAIIDEVRQAHASE